MVVFQEKGFAASSTEALVQTMWICREDARACMRPPGTLGGSSSMHPSGIDVGV
jgi:hypothetical protein